MPILKTGTSNPISVLSIVKCMWKCPKCNNAEEIAEDTSKKETKVCAKCLATMTITSEIIEKKIVSSVVKE